MANFYEAPEPFDSTPDSLLGWGKEFIQQGNSYLRLQPAHKYIKQGMEIIDGSNDDNAIQTLSNVKTGATLRNVKELIAAQTNMRIIPSFATRVNEFYDQKIILNKLYMAWQTGTFADRSIRKAWQYAGAAGTGYTGMRWEPDYWYKGKGDIVLDAYGPMDVIPVGLPKSHDLQKAYGVALKIATPYHELTRKYPIYRDKIHPTGDSSTMGRGTVIAQAVKYATAALRRFGQGTAAEEENTPWPTVDTYYLYIDDDSINYSGQPVFMGEPGTSWSYTVPFVGQEIPVGNDLEGHPVFRKAREEDCKMYPNRRKIVMTDDLILTPDYTRQVNEYWHGKVPVVQWRADDWAWNFLGFPLTRLGASLEKSNIEVMRGMVDAINVKLSPPRAFDRNTMSEALAQTINTRIPNQVVGLDMMFGGEKQIKPLLDPSFYDVPQVAPQFIEANEARIKNQMGVADAAALTRARQLPSGDSFEKIMESMGPLIKDQSRNMEGSVRDLGEMWKTTVFQFYTTARRVQILGTSGETSVDYDYKPGDLVPGNIPGMEGKDRFEVARHHAGNFTFSVTPYSLHELNSVTRKLFHLQLERSKFPISWWTLAEIFDVKDFGKKPMMKDPDTGMDRECATELELWIAQQEIVMRMAAAAQASQGGGQGGGGGKGQGGGRPPTGQNPPSMEQKPNGSSTVRESKK